MELLFKNLKMAKAKNLSAGNIQALDMGMSPPGEDEHPHVYRWVTQIFGVNSVP